MSTKIINNHLHDIAKITPDIIITNGSAFIRILHHLFKGVANLRNRLRSCFILNHILLNDVIRSRIFNVNIVDSVGKQAINESLRKLNINSQKDHTIIVIYIFSQPHSRSTHVDRH
ncbi:hypothetical protein D3C85_1138960 [compost metagenome]